MTRLLIVLAAAAGCSGNLSRKECEGVVDHMIDIFTAPATAAPGKEQQKAIEDWRGKLKGENVTRQHFLDVCTRSMTSSHVSCIEKATDENSLAECFNG